MHTKALKSDCKLNATRAGRDVRGEACTPRLQLQQET